MLEGPATADSRDAELAWATARFPEIASYMTGSQVEALTAALLAWAPPGKSIEVYDRRCRPAEVARRDDVLYGLLTREVVKGAGSISESFDELSVGERLNQFSCNHVEYERDVTGRWIVASSGGGSCMDVIGYGLSRVEGEAAWYDAAAVSLTIECSRKLLETSTCSDGAVRACELCEEWSPRPHSGESNFGMGHQPGVRRVSVSRTCDTPCPPPEIPPDVKRANAALRDRSYFVPIGLDPHPFVFRTSTACRTYRRIHPFDSDELDVWRAGIPRPKNLPRPVFEEDGAGE